jgi:hypothetical protein
MLSPIHLRMKPMVVRHERIHQLNCLVGASAASFTHMHMHTRICLAGIKGLMSTLQSVDDHFSGLVPNATFD